MTATEQTERPFGDERRERAMAAWMAGFRMAEGGTVERLLAAHRRAHPHTCST